MRSSFKEDLQSKTLVNFLKENDYIKNLKDMNRTLKKKYFSKKGPRKLNKLSKKKSKMQMGFQNRKFSQLTLKA